MRATATKKWGLKKRKKKISMKGESKIMKACMNIPFYKTRKNGQKRPNLMSQRFKSGYKKKWRIEMSKMQSKREKILTFCGTQSTWLGLGYAKSPNSEYAGSLMYTCCKSCNRLRRLTRCCTNQMFTSKNRKIKNRFSTYLRCLIPGPSTFFRSPPAFRKEKFPATVMRQ